MRHGRWYPTGIRMADGRIPIISGLDESGKKNPSPTNPDVELFTPPSTIGGVGTISLIGTVGGPGQPPIGGLYPHMFAMPSGHTLVAGPAPEDTWFFDSVSDSNFTWTDIQNLSRPRSWGTTVPLPAGAGGSTKVMALGGTNWTDTPSTTTTEVFDDAQPGLGWRPAASNLIGRGHANTVLLPDGSMVEVGGGVGSKSDFPSPLHAANPEQRQIEVWDPGTGEWRLGPAQSESRAYHSTALLLPDGRMMSAGDEYNGDGVAVDTAEVYKPSYLFRGARPTISAAPDTIQAGAGFGVTTPNTNIAGAALVAPAAVTHGVDMNQRVIQLEVNRRTGCVSITAPAANAAPPGWYMLFLLNDQGVPSVSKFGKLQAGATPAVCTAPLAPDTAAPTVSLTAPTAGTASGPVKVNANASDSDGVVVGVQFKRDGVNLGAEDTRAPFSAPLDTTKVANGPHTLTAVARDAAGHTATASVDVTVANTDTTPPAVALTSPSGGSTVSGTTKVIALAGDDGGLKEIQFKVDGQNIGPAVAANANASYEVSWQTTDVFDGSHVLTAVASDLAGLTATSPGVTVTVDNPASPPTDPVPPEPLPIADPPANDAPSGGSPPASAPAAPPNVAPGISRLKISRGAFRKGTDTKLSFRLSEAAKVSVDFERRIQSRKATRSVRKKTIRLRGKAGPNSVVLRARLWRTFATGRYRLTLLATDTAGKRSIPARTSFRLLESAARHRSRAVRAAVLGWF